jgi:hypothetical protein
MELGLSTPYNPNKVVNLKKFKYDKATSQIVQQQVRKVPVIGGNPLAFVIETIVTKDVIQDPLSIASVSTAFTTTTKRNLRNLYRQNQEKYARIRELKEQKKDEGNLGEFKTCDEKVRIVLEEAIIDMYAHVHVFHQLAANIMEQRNCVQTKNTQLTTISEGLYDIKRWIVENPDALDEIYLPS